MEAVWKKLGSRKLWLALGGMCAGIAMAFGVDGSELNTVAGAVTTAVSVVAYLLAEGSVDAAAAGTVQVKRAVDAAFRPEDEGAE